MHCGAPKVWYGVPGKDAPKLEETMKKHLPDLLHKLVTQLSPAILKSEGVPVYRYVQNAGEFVLTFPRAYHAGFNYGFNCAEAVNVAPIDWLPHGQIAIELYHEQGRKTSISHDRMFLGAAREAVKAHWELSLLKKYTSDNLSWKGLCGKGGVLANTLRKRVEMERMSRECLCSSSQAVKMESSFDAASERECSICFFDLHLSSTGCRCSPDRYACLRHAKQFCSCAKGAEIFLFRYDVNELNILVEAVEGKLSAVYRWARLDLGLALSSYVTKDNIGGRLSHTQGVPKEVTNPSVISSKELPGEEMSKNKPSILSQTSAQMLLLPRNKLSDAALPSEDPNSKLKKGEYVLSSSSLSMPGGQTAMASRVKKPSAPRDNNNILISYESENPVSKRPNEDSVTEHLETSLRLAPSGEKASTYNYKNEAILTTPLTDAVVNQKDANSPDVQKTSSSSHYSHMKDEQAENSITSVGSNHQNIFCRSESATPDSGKGVQDSCNTIEKDDDKNKPSIVEGNLQRLLPLVSENVDKDKHEKQKGPLIAKVVRRINCNVELLEFGTVLSGKLWCNSQAIFPKGLKSRVRYISVLDPTNMAYYVSEILDAERDEPLFMVSVEHYPGEVFVHVSAARCWEMAIEAMDQNRVCTEYWDSRSYGCKCSFCNILTSLVMRAM
ncbi:putative lysine-specific demethylase JMJ14 [Hibiscus syriacus]|uniref:Lysine-specific demethylase JMJ14 n=1 Tax=Hibiscus syriacus TaxID=106335 RepID=A0A6A3D5U8_HIBSY|nr:putative lysine-specific demethylase JMJ14 [Hibiscus syriacus]